MRSIDFVGSARGLAVLALLACAAGPRIGRADIVLDNLGNVNSSVSTAHEIGAAVLVANTAINVTSIILSEKNFATHPGETFNIYSRNGNGTLGSPVYQDFGLSFANGLETATPNTPVVLAANTGYWLMLISPDAGDVNWDYSTDVAYYSAFGVTMPDTKTSVFVNASNTFYSDLGPGVNGPQMLRINGTPVPEPAAASIVAACVVGMLLNRPRRKSGGALRGV